MPKPIVKTKDLNVIYFKGKPNQVDALLNANLEIYPGEFIIFFGPSGCGKSTLLYSIAGLERNIEGSILINDKNLALFNNKDLDFHRQKMIGMIFQAFYLVNSLPVIKNIVLPQFSLDIKTKDREKKAKELMEFFGITKQMEKYPNELSGGQQQRVAICRALINDPQMILADEPTGNLDSKSAFDVMNTLLELNEKQGKTVILVTHSPGSLEYAHRVFYMKDGKIIDEKVNRKLGESAKKENLPDNVLAADLGTDKSKQASTAPEELKAAATLSDWQAKNIVCESLTGYSLDEFFGLERIIDSAVKESKSKFGDKLFNYLDKDIYEGGLGLNSRTARRLAEKMKNLAVEVKHFNEILAKNDPQNVGPEIVEEVKDYLLSYFSFKLRKPEQPAILRELLAERIKGEINFDQLRKQMDLSFSKGGLGLDKRLADKVAKHLEFIILSNKKI
ncbi:MAG: ABC transporter ATP-binding protein [Patescibacteria group bacterium]|jgi:putative ABC transport system ATP-binding protein